MKRTYNIALFTGANTLCKELAQLAAMSNGKEDATDLSIFKSVFDVDKFRYPSSNEDYELTLTENRLTVLLKSGEVYKECLVIEIVTYLS